MALLSAFCFGLPPAHAGIISYHVEVDTSSISGSLGFLNFQFNPGDIFSQNASVDITNYSGDGALDGFADHLGDAAGVLPGDLGISNTDLLNDVFQGITYGAMFSFDIAFSGPAVDAPTGFGAASSFFLLLLDENLFGLLTIDPLETVLTMDLSPTGMVTPITFDADFGGTPSVVTVTDTTPRAAPLPSSLLLLAGALLALVRASRRRYLMFHFT